MTHSAMPLPDVDWSGREAELTADYYTYDGAGQVVDWYHAGSLVTGFAFDRAHQKWWVKMFNGYYLTVDPADLRDPTPPAPEEPQ